MKKTEEYETITLGTKVSQKDMAAIKEIVKELGFNTPYELLKFIVAAMIRYADVWHRPEAENLETATEFFSLFSSIKDKRGLIKQYDEREPRLIIAVFKGGHVVTYRDKSGIVEETENVEQAITELHQITHPITHSLLVKVAQAYGLRSIPKVVEQLAKDAADEIDIPDTELGYTMNEYGSVPKKTRTIPPPL